MKKSARTLWILLALAAFAFSVPAVAAEPESGGILTWRIINDPPALDPAQANITTAARGANLYCETLVEISEDGQKILPLR